jgi:hypothetical protein
MVAVDVEILGEMKGGGGDMLYESKPTYSTWNIQLNSSIDKFNLILPSSCKGYGRDYF